jgi:hypothetical protein
VALATTSVIKRTPLVLLALVVVGVALRVWLTVAYQPAVLWGDGSFYLRMVQDGLYDDPLHPAGYAIFLEALRSIWSDLDLTIALQHTIGVVTALFLFASVSRIGVPVWAAAAAAAGVLLSLDQIRLEHALTTEPLFALLLSVAIYASVRALDEPRSMIWTVTSRHLWIGGAGATLAAAALVRSVSAPMIVALVVWVVLFIPGKSWSRLGHAGMAAGAAAVVMLAYFAANHASTGHFGLVRAPGWGLYARAATFADCREFAPPSGTRSLCEATPSDRRAGPDFYLWTPASPARRVFGEPPEADDKLLAFAREAIAHQPSAYVEAVVRDGSRYFVPGLSDDRAFDGEGYEYLDLTTRNLSDERVQLVLLHDLYSDEQLEIRSSVDTLADVQHLVRVHPPLMLLALVAAIFGAALSRGSVRAGLVLLLGAGVLLLVIPSATLIYTSRYAVPATGPLIAAGAIGAWVVTQRLSRL